MKLYRLFFLTAVIACLIGISTPTHAAIPSAERSALIALYNSTGGSGWRDNTNWLGAAGTECSWYGVSCDASETHVTQLDLYHNQLSGSIPTELGNLSNLYGLRLYSNQLSGSIPTELGNLSNLQYLYLNSNQLCGSIPSELGNLSNLQDLRLYSNQLSGSIPPELGNLSNLQYLWLYSNQLSGSIPPELGNLSNLKELWLSSNQLSGSIPTELGNLSNLQDLYLSSNQLSGSIPPELGNLSNLKELWLSSNQLSGSIPSELGDLSNLQGLILDGNQLSGSIPSELGNLSNLQGLSLDSNQLSGSIPSELGNLSNLQGLYLHSNQLSGSIPPELGNLSNLYGLRLYSNQLSGSIPSELGNLSNLSPSYTDIGYNALWTNDPTLEAFLDGKDADWYETQTIAPVNLSVGTVGDHSVQLSWDSVSYTADAGGYALYYKQTSDSSWVLSARSSSKATTSFPVTGLTAGTQYDFALKTYTNPHAHNDNEVLSDLSELVTATTGNTGCTAPVISTTGASPWILTVTASFDSYNWSTGETTQSISVSPTVPTYYSVITTTSGPCEEAATVLVNPDLVSDTETTLIPGAAHAAGASGTSWLTDLQLYNPGAEAVDARIAFLPGEADNSTVEGVDLNLEAGTTMNLDDVVGGLLGSSGAGALRIEHSAPLLAASRTYNTAESGTFGQFIPGVSTRNSLLPDASTYLIGLSGNRDFRTNIGCANASGQTASFNVKLFDSDGLLLWEEDENLQAWGWLQLNKVFDSAGYSDVHAGAALITNTSSEASIIPYASIVDAITGDPTYVTGTTPARPGLPVWIDGSAHGNGVGASVWRTDLELANFSAVEVTATITLLMRDEDNSSAQTSSVDIEAGTSSKIADLLQTLFETTGAAAIKIDVDAGELLVASRTYNQAEEGTYGQFVPSFPESDAIIKGQNVVLLSLRQNENFRTNVGFVNTTAQWIAIQATFYASDGQTMNLKDYHLAPYSYIQDNHALPEGVSLDGGFAQLSTDTSGGAFFAYASVVDNGSDDPIFIPAENIPE